MVCIYEGEGAQNLAPLIDLRAVFELRCGARTLLEKFRQIYPRERFVLWVRNEIAELVRERYPDCAVNVPVRLPAIFIYAGTILTHALPVKEKERVFLLDGRMVAVRLSGQSGSGVVEDYRALRGLIRGVAEEEISAGDLKERRRGEEEKRSSFPRAARAVFYPWELLKYHPEELRRELTVVCPRPLVTGPGAQIERGAYIITETGPVYVDRGAKVRPGSVVYGPCYVGPGTLVDSAIVRPGCSFGPGCRIGGEVEESIFQGYANKHHEGFIGHSYVGEWVNLGALTTCSDLKNNYQPVRMKVRGRRHQTGMLKLGCVIGDHVKTAIGTLIPTGAVIGTFANWFRGGMMPRELPAFSWGKKGRWRVAEMVECARRVMARRDVVMSPAYERVLRKFYQRTAGAAKASV